MNQKQMENKKLNRLKEVLSIPTHSRSEGLMIEYLERTLTEKGYSYKKDSLGSIYVTKVTKGNPTHLPCFVAHTDTVHHINHNLMVVQLEEDDKTILTGIDSETLKPSGIGGDDKCGVFLCLEMLDKLDNVKVALFVSEEIGCIGSHQADTEFFKNVGYAIQYDSPKGNSMSLTLMGKKLFNEKSDFGGKVSNLIVEHGITSWERHPYTDIWPLMEKFNFSCLNLAAGYHRYHTHNEYVVVEEVQNAFELGLRLHENLGESFYERKEEEVKVNRLSNLFYGDNNKTLILEAEDDYSEEDDTFESNEDEESMDELNKDSYKIGEFEDLWDYEDFNGGYSIKNYSESNGESNNDYCGSYDW